MWFDCFKDDICIVIKFMLKEFVFLVLKLFFVDGFQDVVGVFQFVLKSRKFCKLVVGEQGYVQYDFEMDDVVFVFIDEKRKRRCVFYKCLCFLVFFFSFSDELGVEIFFDVMGVGCF